MVGREEGGRERREGRREGSCQALRGRSATLFWRAIPFMPASPWKYDGNVDLDGNVDIDGDEVDGKDDVYHKDNSSYQRQVYRITQPLLQWSKAKGNRISGRLSTCLVV